MAVQFQSRDPGQLAASGGSPPLSRHDEEQLTMQKRIEAFYKQSGGPNNPEIPKILERHLLYGKDHGPRGKRETLEDALRDMVAQDYSNQIIFKWLMQARMARNRQNQADPAELARIRREIENLQKQVAELREMVQSLAASIEGPEEGERAW